MPHESAADRALRMINAYRNAFREEYGQAFYDHMQIWWEHGWFYLWHPYQYPDGRWGMASDRPYAMRGNQIEALTETLKQRKGVIHSDATDSR